LNVPPESRSVLCLVGPCPAFAATFLDLCALGTADCCNITASHPLLPVPSKHVFTDNPPVCSSDSRQALQSCGCRARCCMLIRELSNTKLGYQTTKVAPDLASLLRQPRPLKPSLAGVFAVHRPHLVYQGARSAHLQIWRLVGNKHQRNWSGLVQQLTWRAADHRA